MSKYIYLQASAVLLSGPDEQGLGFWCSDSLNL